MFGELLSSVVKVVTLPVDVVESAIDVASGGDGTKQSKQYGVNPMSEARDLITDALEDLDK